MTKRDGDSLDKMTKLDRDENCRRKSPSRPESGRDFLDYSDVHSPGKNSTGRQSTSGSFSEFSAASFRDSPRSAPSSLPGSRCGSTPGSRLASRSNSQESIIDLFDSMTLQFGQQLGDGPGQAIQLFSPKPRPLRQWSWQERVRVNHAIWRSWHMQYVKGKKPSICQFSAPTPDARQRLQADVIQGRPINKQFNPSQISSAIRDYNKWRMFGRELFVGEGSIRPIRTPEDHAINLDMPHPPLSPMSAQKLMNDDTLKDFSDTLFISTEKKNFTVPAPKKITRHVYNSDIIQPGLMQLEPDFLDQDFMETLDSLQDILSKTPTKSDVDTLGMHYNLNLPPNFLSDATLGALSEDMEIVDHSKTTATNNTYPIAIISNTSGKPVMNQRSVSFAPAPTSVVTSQYDPMLSSSNHLFASDTLTNHVAAHHAPAMSGAQGGMQHHQHPHQQQQHHHPHHIASMNQSPNLLQAMSSKNSSSSSGSNSRHSPHSPQRSLPMTTTSFQPQEVAGPMTSTVHNNQGYSVVYSKMGAQSPTPTSPPACIQGVPMPPHSSAMGIITEAIDVLSCQIPLSPSKLIPDWQQGQFPGQPQQLPGQSQQLPGQSQQLPGQQQHGQTWAPNTSMANSLDNLSGHLKTTSSSSVGGIPFQSYGQVQTDFRTSMDPMGPMDQGAVLGMGHQQQHHQQQQQQQQHQQQPQRQQQQLDMATTMQVMEGMSPQHAPDEHMDYEQYPTVAMGIGASGITVYKQPKREPPYSRSENNSRSNSKANSRANSRPGSRGNSRASSRASSPRTSFTSMSSQPFQDSLEAALQGKSDGKDVGLRSPSTDRDLAISVPSSCQASTASSAASSPSSQIDYPETPNSIREFEFSAPRPKRQKTPESGGKDTKDKETRRRIKHLHSEHKRRFHIQSGLDELQGMIPGMSNGGSDNNSKISTATMLQKAHEYILHLKEENSSLRTDVEKAREDIQRVNDEICECQDSLPDTGAPVNSQSERHLQEMCDDYINRQMQENWKFWIFSMLARPLFASYVTAVCANPGAGFDEEVTDWVEESCRLKPLRKLVYTIVRQISTRTSVLQNPVQLPEEVKEIIREEISKPRTEQS